MDIPNALNELLIVCLLIHTLATMAIWSTHLKCHKCFVFGFRSYMLFEFCSKSMYFLDTWEYIHTIHTFKFSKSHLLFTCSCLRPGFEFLFGYQIWYRYQFHRWVESAFLLWQLLCKDNNHPIFLRKIKRFRR